MVEGVEGSGGYPEGVRYHRLHVEFGGVRSYYNNMEMEAMRYFLCFARMSCTHNNRLHM